MIFHNLFDSHVHSDNSPDGHHSTMYLAECAEHGGLMGIAITDHAECLGWGPRAQTRVVQSMVDAAKTAEAFRHRISVAAGVEIGMTRDLAVADTVVGLYPFDFVLASIHQSRDGRDILALDYAAMSPGELRALMEEYLEDLLHVVEWGRCHSLAHMSFPLRAAARDGVAIDLRQYADQVDLVLRGLIERGIALELNTSGLRRELNDTLPPAWVVRRYRELGGELVTVGSDAHRAGELGYGMNEGMALLAEAGFGYFAFFRRQKPIMLRIV